MQKTPLPIDDFIGDILSSLETRPTLALVAPPGAGKTTRLPPALLCATWRGEGKIVVSQPRRVAARAAARRVAAENGWTVGGEVGYAVRGDSKAGPSTGLLFVTEGVLSGMLQADPFLEGVSCLVFDEFHERSLEGDLALALAKEIASDARPDLRVIVCSATLDPGPVAEYLRAPTIEVPGRLYPVETLWLDRQPPERLEDAVYDGVRELWQKRPGGKGDLLVFLPGAGEIRRAAEKLGPWAEAKGVRLSVLHGDLTAQAQDEALAPSPFPRVILATNVAETSLTIEGVSGVVDSGLVKLSEYDPQTGMTRLDTVRASKASSVQRAGRAGRTGPGVALRLWTRHDELSRPDRTPPEVNRADLARAVLELAAWGHANPAAFEWFERPDEARLAEATALLAGLGAVDSSGAVTPLGTRMLALPLHPRLARLLSDAAEKGLGFEAAALCAVLEERDVSLAGRAFGRGNVEAHSSDALLRVDIVERAEAARFSYAACREMGIDGNAARNAARERDRLRGLIGSRSGERAATAESALLKLIFEAYPDRVAKLESAPSRYLLASGRGATLSETSSCAGAEYVVALRIASGRRGERSEERILWASAVEKEWLFASPLATVAEESGYDEKSGRAVAARATRFGRILLKSSPVKPDPEQAAETLFEALKADPLAALKPGDRALALAGRINFLAKALGEDRLPRWTSDSWRELLHRLCRGRYSLAELREADHASEMVATLERHARALLQKEAPEKVRVPSGRELPVEYPEDAPPYVAVKIQEVFGLARTPRLGEGRVPLVMHLVGPSGRPLQVTSDLESFWKNGYPMVLKEMKGRYPKHYWPENPWEATPTARTVKPRPK